MTSHTVFTEPLVPSDGPFKGWADWYRHSGSPEATKARATINAWYADLPDRESMVLSRLQGNDDTGIVQAIDELYIYNLIPKSYEVRYEEDESSPDFRIYREASEYMADLEVYTQFMEKDFSSTIERNSNLTKEINRRIKPDSWYVYFDVREWKRQPRVSELIKWLELRIATLVPPVEGMQPENYPTDTYTSTGLRLDFTFLPRTRTATARTNGPIVKFGPIIAGWTKSDKRLRQRLTKKSGSKYDYRGKPFAIVATIRDELCDIDDVINAIYGNEVMKFEIDNPGSARLGRKSNGIFTKSAAYPEGRNRRLSCVFAVMKGWNPGTTKPPEVIRFDNPWAEHMMPDEILTYDRRFAARRDEHGRVRMEWES